MVDRISALAGQEMPRNFGPDLTMTERRLGAIWQLAAWPGEVAGAGKLVARTAGVRTAPGPRASASGKTADLLRIEPLKWLLTSDAPIEKPEMGATGTPLDLSHARTVIRLQGEAVPELMARLTPLDLRESAFPEGSVATSAIDHVAVTLHAREGGLEVYCFRSFGLSIWEHVANSAEQFAIV
ncbi:MAG: sarcosine oxidase subunit gamma [Pseudomonadota bacterium]